MADGARTSVAGAVLTGGSSTRMGVDKTVLDVGGAPLAAHAARALSEAGITEIACIGGDPDSLGRVGVAVVADRWPGEGPLGGIITALDTFPGAEVVVVSAGDLVAPHGHVVVRLLDELDGSVDVQLVVPVVAGRVQWLLGAWRRSARSPLHDAFAAGERAIHRAVRGLTVRTIDGVDEQALRDADTPEDLAAADLARRRELP